jgi:hypothetical protein
MKNFPVVTYRLISTKPSSGGSEDAAMIREMNSLVKVRCFGIPVVISEGKRFKWM